MKKDFLEITDLTRDELLRLFDIARHYKASRNDGKDVSILKHKHIGLVFRKPSTRTRVSFEIAVAELGGSPMYLSGEATQISRGETNRDTAQVLSRYLHGLVIRTHGHAEVEEFAAWCPFPVVNALTDAAHPCQALADYFTILEKKGTLDGLKLTYIGDANNVCNSLILGAGRLGVEIRISAPAQFAPSRKIIERAGGPVRVSEDPYAFIAEADVVYTDTWVSMGNEKEIEQRKKIFAPYQVNGKLMAAAKKDVLFMHCLPAHRGWEVSDEVLDGPRSVVIDQAENRLHCQKALLHMLYSRS